MSRDFSAFLWALKLGAVINLYLLASTFAPPLSAAAPGLLIPARILLVVSAFRCVFPVQYKGNIVFHDTLLSSIFLTRFLATFSEIAYIFQLAYVLRLLNVEHVGWIDVLSWLMVVQVVVSQTCVWTAIITGNFIFYFWEELGWEFIFAANTIVSAYLRWTLPNVGPAAILLDISLLFGLFYLPWQVIHLKVELTDARKTPPVDRAGRSLVAYLRDGLVRSIRERHPTNETAAWSGLVGLTWMTGYWATVIPLWVHRVVVVMSSR
jgi:hypothetical protein